MRVAKACVSAPHPTQRAKKPARLFPMSARSPLWAPELDFTTGEAWERTLGCGNSPASSPG